MLANTSQVLSSYREVADSHGILQQPLEADSPAGHSPLRLAPVALDARQAGITVQTVVAAAALQLHAVQLWSHTNTQLNSCTVVGWPSQGSESSIIILGKCCISQYLRSSLCFLAVYCFSVNRGSTWKQHFQELIRPEQQNPRCTRSLMRIL